ncbi:MAG: phosphoglucomutase/phosphomannomutase PgmG [Rickettsiales bacterium]
MTHHFDPTILREYDIRGIIGETLSKDDAYAIGRAFGSFKPEWKSTKPRIAIGMDGRLSSPELVDALTKGLMECGAEVLHIGIGPTPMLYFAVCSEKLDGGIMVTGSHNPPSHNGFKFMLGKKPFYGEDIQQLGRIASSGNYYNGDGTYNELAVEKNYIDTLLDAYRGKRPLKAAWDAGNGAAGRVMQALTEQLPGTHTALFADIDGNFPNHHPDPSVAKNLQDIIATVKDNACDVGLAFDGDGDRIGVVDETGEILWGDQLLAIYASELLAEQKGATVIADVKASQTLFDRVKELGGKPLMYKTGHSLIKSKMAETGAPLAGEMSGHMFFADHYYGYDDGLYAAVRLLSLLSNNDKKLSDLRKELPQTYSTPELRIACDEAQKFSIIEAVKTRLKNTDADVNDVDGVRVNTKDGWWLLRASNTQAVLVARCESTSPRGLKTLQEALESELATHGIKHAA